MANIRIGTSGWHYADWAGPFYPGNMAPEHFLAYYAARFSSVEINNIFYRLPAAGTVRQWARATPAGFRFACKASRYTTHMKKLKSPEASSTKFFAAIAHLGEKCGPVLFQLPGRWRVNEERLDTFLQALPAGYRYAFEFRDRSWLCAGVHDILRRHGAALCVYDLEGFCSPLVDTAEFAYVRLHGPGEAHAGSYGDDSLTGWADKIGQWARAGMDVHCYFNNDRNGAAPKNAARLMEIVTRDMAG